RGARLVLSGGWSELPHAGHRHGAVRRRSAPAEARFPAPGGRRSARGEHPQVPAQAAEPVRLCAGRLHGRAVDTSERCVPRRRVRLEQARRRPAGSDLAAHLRGRSGRRAAPAGTYRAEPAALGSVAEPCFPRIYAPLGLLSTSSSTCPGRPWGTRYPSPRPVPKPFASWKTPRGCGGAAGSCTVTWSPPPARGVRVRVPSCAWVMLLTIARPRPTPAWSVRMRSVPRRNGSASVATDCGVSFPPVFSTVSSTLLGGTLVGTHT